ncbi:hypothetical protein KY330_03790 [Candidatus Woesearchaeota archaeon]|nr:hypothetical protein [Candidatus Woesearchaeota archaeon]
MIQINMLENMVWRYYRTFSRLTGLCFDTMIIGLYGSKQYNDYLDYYITSENKPGIKELSRMVIEDTIDRRLI